MKTALKIFYWLAGIVVLLLVIGLFLPKTYKVEKSISIKSKPETVYMLVSNFKLWKLWSPWTKESDPTARFEFAGENGKTGTTWTWEGEKMGSGVLTVTEVKPSSSFTFEVAFQKGKYKSAEQFTIGQTGDSCQVSWTDKGDFGFNPVARFMGLFMDRMMGKYFEQGLAKLKTVAEARSHWPKLEEKTWPPHVFLAVTDSAGPATYGSVMGRAFGEIMGVAKAEKLVVKGAPFAIYQRWDSVTMFSVMDLGIPVAAAEKGKGRVRVVNYPEQKVVLAYYFGPYAKTATTYKILDQYIAESEMQCTGGPWEIYVTDPMVEKDTAKWETVIAFPVK